MARFRPLLIQNKFYLWIQVKNYDQFREMPSAFALMVDKLRMINEAELKLAYVRLFRDELSREWEDITSKGSFGEIGDEEIIASILKKRYGHAKDYTAQGLKKLFQFCCPNEEAAMGIIVVSLTFTAYHCQSFLTL